MVRGYQKCVLPSLCITFIVVHIPYSIETKPKDIAWDYVAKDIVSDIAVYHWKGPRRPSWGLEMTMLAAFMRNMASHTHLVDVPTLRFAMSIGGLIPTPSDALITPVTFRVRKRGLRGMLEKWDALEDGKREIPSEWVVSKRLWGRLQKEWKGLQQQDHRKSSSSKMAGSHNRVKERVVLFLHGGTFFFRHLCFVSWPAFSGSFPTARYPFTLVKFPSRGYREAPPHAPMTSTATEEMKTFLVYSPDFLLSSFGFFCIHQVERRRRY